MPTTPLRKVASLYHTRLGNRPIDNCNGAHITSIRRPIEERNDRDNIRRLHKMPACQSLLGAGTHSHGKDVICRQLGLSQRSEHVCKGQRMHKASTSGRQTFVCEIIAHAEHKLWRITSAFTILLYEPLRDLALVDEPRANFKVGLACHDFDIVLLGYSPLQMLLTFPGLECAVLRVRPSVVPGECNLLALDERACQPVSKGLFRCT